MIFYRNGERVEVGDIVKVGNSTAKVDAIFGSLARVVFPETLYFIDPLNWDVELVKKCSN